MVLIRVNKFFDVLNSSLPQSFTLYQRQPKIIFAFVACKNIFVYVLQLQVKVLMLQVGDLNPIYIPIDLLNSVLTFIGMASFLIRRLGSRAD